MPLRLAIDHARKFVHVVAEGTVTLRDMEAHFDRLVVEDALGYAKLFDATEIQPGYSESDMYALAARLSAYASLKNGPLAIVAVSEQALLASERFLNLSMSRRAGRIFADETAARVWLAQAQPDGPV
jgi:hypothetical protein